MKPLFAPLLAAFAALTLAADPAEARGGAGHCPPGLAKKNPPCVPPGLARRGGAERYDGDHRYDGDRRYDDDDDDGRHYDDAGRRYDDDGRAYDEGYRDGFDDGYRIAVGDVLGEGDYDLIRNPPLFGLPAYGEDAWRYYLVRDLVVRADPETRQVLAIVGLIDALLN
jgi:hypothetical protein